MATHRHCESFEEHKPHTWLYEEPSAFRYGMTASSYYCECSGTNADQAKFSNWVEEMMEVPLAGWEKVLIMNFSQKEQEEFKLSVPPKRKL